MRKLTRVVYHNRSGEFGVGHIYEIGNTDKCAQLRRVSDLHLPCQRLLPRHASRRRWPQAHYLPEDDDLPQVMCVVVRNLNYAVSSCHVRKVRNLHSRNNFLVQIPTFRHFYQGFEAADES